MARGFRWLIAGAGPVLAGTVLLASATARAEIHDVKPGGGLALAEAIAAAHPGDTIKLSAGRYPGPVILDRPGIVLLGDEGAIIDGGGTGHAVMVAAPGVTVRGLTIRNSGRSLESQDSGIFVDKAGDRAIIEGNRIENSLIGVYLWGPDAARVSNNRIDGIRDMRVNERGNGIQLWNTPGSIVEGNHIRWGRDGIFVTTSRDNIFRDNRFQETRFAVHYMYTNDSEVSGNVSEGNHVGYALMFSKRLKVRGNLSRNDRDHGFLLNYANRSEITGNRVVDGKTKCVFIYNSNKNVFRGNRFEGCGIGIHFTAGSERNTLTGNAFIGNRTQVKYVGTRWLDWTADGRGNYWSDNPAFDLDGDGIGDTPYRPNDLIDQVVWAHPVAKMLLNAPGIQMVRWAQSRFPALHPGGVTDSAPLMVPPAIAADGEG
ncbi:MAG: nitrous oxide reductase family maturation protein NosD [Rhodospirillales bacterium]|nr:nitrous oxide reductase family maturation protein NosD [Rhodospirillales bacterium]